jgi:hemerythrin-like domain-containing protein
MGENEPQNKKKYYDLISLIESEQDTILEKLTGLEKYVWSIEKLGMTDEIYNSIKSLNDYIFNDVSRYFTLEEDLLLPELEKVMPGHSSSAVMRQEHSMILNTCSMLQKMLEKKDNAEKEKDTLQAEIISLVDILQRHLHKKNHMLYHEVQTMLPSEIQNSIYLKMLKRIGG